MLLGLLLRLLLDVFFWFESECSLGPKAKVPLLPAAQLSCNSCWVYARLQPTIKASWSILRLTGSECVSTGTTFTSANERTNIKAKTMGVTVAINVRQNEASSRWRRRQLCNVFMSCICTATVESIKWPSTAIGTPSPCLLTDMSIVSVGRHRR